MARIAARMPSLRTPLCGVLDVEYPVIQAPVGSVSCPELAAAVSNAGGLGTLAVTWRDFAETRRVIEATRELTDAPFGVNLVLDDDATVYDTEAHVETCLDAGAPVVSFSFGDASPYVGTVHDAGALAAVTVGSAAAAADAVDAGADVVVAQGWEAGGHVQSEVATMPLVPRVADAVGDVPVVAAGGIADGRGVAAALALGADGAWLGTRFVATEEAHAHERYKRALVEAVETDTLHSELFDKGWPGTPHRTLRNETVRAWDAAGRPQSGERPGEAETVATGPAGDVERYTDDPPLPEMDGDVDAMAEYAGQSTGLANEVRPAGAVVESLVEETTFAIDAVGRLRR
ncbi:nitronate monooxygenase [Haloarculaceae archaeon H-GB1-1]|nr:nitronate monooxygenase [Haloarculaceae archaeon H-GB1-1]